MPANSRNSTPEIITIGRKAILTEFVDTVFKNFTNLLEALDRVSLITKVFALLFFIIFCLTFGSIAVVWLIVNK